MSVSEYLPSEPLRTWRVKVGASTVTIAFGTGSPESELVSVPVTVPVCCADAAAAKPTTRVSTAHNRLVILMEAPRAIVRGGAPARRPPTLAGGGITGHSKRMSGSILGVSVRSTSTAGGLHAADGHGRAGQPPSEQEQHHLDP